MGTETFNEGARYNKEEALDEANLMRGLLIKRGAKPEDFSKEDYDWALDKVVRIKELARAEDIKELANGIVRILGDIATIPAAIVAVVLDLIGELPLQDRSYWAQKNRPNLLNTVLEMNADLKRVFSTPGKEELSRAAGVGDRFAEKLNKEE
jgi:hypothetical protein